MMFTLLALLVVCLSLILMIGGLRMAAQDTFQILHRITLRAHSDGDLAPRLAFVLLWIMIFALSYF